MKNRSRWRSHRRTAQSPLGQLNDNSRQQGVHEWPTTIYDAVSRNRALVDSRGNRFSFSYDAVGRCTASIDPLSRRTTYVFDNADRLI